jgi:hypothetical protein
VGSAVTLIGLYAWTFQGCATFLGEDEVLAIPATDLMRLRFDPFSSSVDRTIGRFLGMGTVKQEH